MKHYDYYTLQIKDKMLKKELGNHQSPNSFKKTY